MLCEEKSESQVERSLTMVALMVTCKMGIKEECISLFFSFFLS